MKIEVRGLSKRYGNHIIFNNLNFDVVENKITCLYGASGCGKTTILNIIGMIEKYESGTVKYNGKEIKKQKDRINFLRNDVGFIFQDFGLLENETVFDNLNLVYKIKKNKTSADDMEAVLNKLNLYDIVNKKVHELSGGEQQRVAIAKIILKNPSVILADEPTASLDHENKNVVLSMLRMLQQDGKTIVIVSHDEKVKEFADIAIDLSGGVIND